VCQFSKAASTNSPLVKYLVRMRDGCPCSRLIGVVHLHATDDHAHEERREESEVGD
jgi:hypothetical protein